MKDEFYHRHIIQYNLFAPVFDLFRERSNSVGNDLLSSAILEVSVAFNLVLYHHYTMLSNQTSIMCVFFSTPTKMCDFICQENIKSLIDYIVSQHLSDKKSASSNADDNNKINSSLEDIANPHVTTFQQLRMAYDKNHHNSEEQNGVESSLRDGDHNNMNGSDDGVVANGRGRPTLNKIALEDQVSISTSCFPTITCIHMKVSNNIILVSLIIVVTISTAMQRKFHQADEDDSYFNDDDDDGDDAAVARENV